MRLRFIVFIARPPPVFNSPLPGRTGTGNGVVAERFKAPDL